MNSEYNYITKILKGTNYSGNSKKHSKSISCSQLGSEPQEALLRYKYGVMEQDSIGQNTLGSLVHKGLDSIFEKESEIRCAYKVEKELDNGWKLTGEIDRLDIKNRIIVDTKVTKTYTIKKILEEPLHPYRLQINGYRYLVENLLKEKYKMVLEIFNKQGGYDVRSGNTVEDLTYIEINRIEDSVIEEHFNRLIRFIEIGKEQQCSDVWMRKVKGNSVPLKCLKYCSYNKVCKFYNPKPQTAVKGWL